MRYSTVLIPLGNLLICSRFGTESKPEQKSSSSVVGKLRCSFFQHCGPGETQIRVQRGPRRRNALNNFRFLFRELRPRSKGEPEIEQDTEKSTTKFQRNSVQIVD